MGPHPPSQGRPSEDPGASRGRLLGYTAWVAFLAVLAGALMSLLAPLWVAAVVGSMVTIVTGTMAERFVRHPQEENAPVIRRRLLLIWLLGSGMFIVGFAIAAFARDS